MDVGWKGIWLFLASKGLTIEHATRLEIAAYVRHLLLPRPGASNSRRRDPDVLANATLQQRVTVIRLFYDYLVEGGFGNEIPFGTAAWAWLA